jgi:hypothetical protein
LAIGKHVGQLGNVKEEGIQNQRIGNPASKGLA